MSYEEIISLASRRGFFWNAYEIYGGVRGFLTWGPLGTIMKRKIADLWRQMFVHKHEFIEIDSPTIAPYTVWEASGHIEHFKDIMITCANCQRKYKADQLLEEHGIKDAELLDIKEIERIIREKNIRCPECGGNLTNPSYFMTMFRTAIGPYTGNEAFLRPETAQGMFTEFKRLYIVTRESLPLGIAQIGRGYRNEISPRQGPIRLREFDMMELEVFYDPKNPSCPYLTDVENMKINLLHEKLRLKGEDKPEEITIKEALESGYIISEWLAYFMGLAQEFMIKLGIPREKQRFKEKLPGERAHYSRQTFDQEVYLSRWGWVEVSGHADRSDYDLSRHMKMSGQDLTAKRYLKTPVVVEKRIVKPKIESIKKVFPNIGRIMQEISRRKPEQILKDLEDKGYIQIGDLKLDKSMFEIITEKEKISVERFVPYVAEPSFGLDRVSYATLEYAYRKKENRVILSLPPYIAPIEAAVFPIVDKPQFTEIALRIKEDLVKEGFKVIYEAKESIGRRYARIDEIGVPVAFTVDGQTIEDNTVTARDRDTWKQVRIKIDDCGKLVRLLLKLGSFNKALESIGIHP